MIFNILSNRKKSTSLLLAAIAILTLLNISSCSKEPVPDSPGKPGEPPVQELPAEFNPATDNLIRKDEFRAAWLTTAWSLDWPQTATGATAQKALLISQLDKLKALNINVVLFQVRTSSDAFYNSTLVPWSHYITGTQGVNPGYDPLLEAINAAHERGMELHAWLNPYRVGSDTQYFAPNHPALAHPDWYVVFQGVRYWNPGLPQVRSHICDIVREIVENYDVDGIHFDDYFYPSGSKSTSNPYVFDDRAAYEQYGNNINIHTWREENVNKMVLDVKNTIKSIKPYVMFGISPMGTHANAMTVYANGVTWMKSRYVDYLAPQIYWEIGHSTADFDTHIRFWNNESSGTPVVPGIAAYKYGDNTYPAFSNPVQFLNQITLSRSLTNVYGNCWFRTNHIVGNLGSYIQSNIYKYSALVPKFGDYSGTVPGIPQVTVTGSAISWGTTSGAKKYAVYELERVNKSNTWNANLKSLSATSAYSGQKGKNYIVIAVNDRERSAWQKVVYIP